MGFKQQRMTQNCKDDFSIVTDTVIVPHNDEHRYIGELESDVIDHEEKKPSKV